MDNTVFVQVKTLPHTVQKALHACGYRKADIAIKGRESFTLESAYGSGYRAFAVVLNMETGESKTFNGSWGGSNPFESRRVDTDESEHSIPVNGAAITGQCGGTGGKVSARLYVRPDALPKYLPETINLSDKSKGILYAFNSLKAGFYRQDELTRMGATDSDIANLVTLGLIKVNKAGSKAITTEGKNALGSFRGNY